MDDLEKQSSANAQIGSKSSIFRPKWPSNLTNDLENYRAPLPCSQKLYVSFHSHRWIQIGFIVRKHSNWIKIVDFSACVALACDRWQKKPIGHLFHAPRRCMVFHGHPWIGIGAIIRKRYIGAKSFLTFVTLIFDLRPWPFAWSSFLYPRSTEGGMGVNWIHSDVCTSICPSIRPSVDKVSGTFWKKLLAQFISYLAFTLMGWVSWPLYIFVFLASFLALWWPNIWPKMGFPELFEIIIGSIQCFPEEFPYV